MSRLASRVSDKLAWPRSRALNTGAAVAAAAAAAAATDDVVAVELEELALWLVVVELAVLLYFKYDFS